MTARPFTGSGRRRAPAAAPPAPRRRPLCLVNFGDTARFRPPATAEPLEPRALLATFTVTTTADDGPGSLRQAMLDANVAPDPKYSIIQFAIPTQPGVVPTIRPLSALPEMTATVEISASNDNRAPPRINIDGTAAGPNVDGIVLRGSFSVSTGWPSMAFPATASFSVMAAGCRSDCVTST